jgi:hypothetical protein
MTVRELVDALLEATEYGSTKAKVTVWDKTAGEHYNFEIVSDNRDQVTIEIEVDPADYEGMVKDS